MPSKAPRGPILLADFSGPVRPTAQRGFLYLNTGYLAGIGAEAERLGLETFDVTDSWGFIQDPLAFARKHGAAALIGRMVPCEEAHGRRWLDLAGKIPVINLGFDPFHWRGFPGLMKRAHRERASIHYIGPDETPGYAGILRSWAGHADRSVAFVGTQWKPYSWSRLEALKAACAPGGWPEPVVFMAATETGLLKTLTPRIIRADIPRHLFFETDHLAASFLDTCPQRRLPEGIHLCGFDDAPLRISEHGTNPFTTLRQDFPAQGRLAVRLVHDLLKGRLKGGQRILAPVAPVLRDKRPPKGSTDDEFRRHAAGAVERHFASARASEEVARDLGLSQEYFLVRFQKAFGVKFTQALANARVKRAAHLLRSTPSTILDIQLECGFGTHQSFARHFRRVHGMTPGDYRDRL